MQSLVSHLVMDDLMCGTFARHYNNTILYEKAACAMVKKSTVHNAQCHAYTYSFIYAAGMCLITLQVIQIPFNKLFYLKIKGMCLYSMNRFNNISSQHTSLCSSETLIWSGSTISNSFLGTRSKPRCLVKEGFWVGGGGVKKKGEGKRHLSKTESKV